LDIQKFVWVAFSETIRLVSNRRNGEFKMFRMPPEKVKKFEPNVRKEFFKILERNSTKMNAFYDKCEKFKTSTNVIISTDNAKSLKSIPNNNVDLIITSPPYGDSRTTVAYGEFSRLSLQWIDLYDLSETEIMRIDKSLMGGLKYRNGFEYSLPSTTLKKSLEQIKDIDIERAGDVFSFYMDLDDTLKSISEKSKSGSYQFWVVGNRTVKVENLKTDKILCELGQRYGLKHIHTIGRNISNKVMPSFNSPSNVSGESITTMVNEHIVIFRKI
jgi:site-specific DNA-methyltransferase (cytosine-N4-specific)